MENISSILFCLVFCFSLTYGEYLRYQVRETELLIDSASCENRPCTGDVFCNQNCTGIQVCVNNNMVCDTTQCDTTAEHCDPVSVQCSSGAVDKYHCSSSAGYQFQCVEAGIFPDPFSCDQYYCCSSARETPAPRQCEAGTKYDPIVGRCTAGARCTTTPVPTCLSGLSHTQCDILESDIYISYICVADGSGGYAPILYNCESGLYDPTTCQCQATSESKSVRRKVAEEVCTFSNVTVAPPITTVTPPTAPTEQPVCSIPYINYPYVNDDCHYCHCTSSLTCEIHTCFIGTHFNSKYGECCLGFCGW